MDENESIGGKEFDPVPAEGEDKGKELKPESGHVRCPCCGQYTLKKPVKPGDDLLNQWLACTATGTPFSHTYRLYGGKLLVTAIQPGADAVAGITAAAAAIERAIDDSGYSGLHTAELQTMLNAVRLFTCVREITFTAPSHRTYDTGAAADQAVDLLKAVLSEQRKGSGPDAWGEKMAEAHRILGSAENMSAIPVGVLLAVGQTHSQLTEILMSAGFDQDFWQGIELA